MAGGPVVNNPPALQALRELWIRPLGGEGPLEEARPPTPVFLLENPWTEEPGGYSPQRPMTMCSGLDTTEET